MPSPTTSAPLAALLLTAVSTAPLKAQSGMPPAPQMEKFEPLLGTWKGSGSLTESASGVNLELDIDVEVQFSSILEGHFIERKMVLQIERAPGPIEALTYMGWDMQTGTFRLFTVANQPVTDSFVLNELHWVSDSSIVEFETGQSEQGATQNRWQTAWEADVLTMKFDRIAVGEQVATLMDLKLEKQKEGSVEISNRPFFPERMPRAPEPFGIAKKALADSNWLLGDWEVEGWAVNEMADSVKIDAKGTEVVDSIFDGLVYRSKLKIALGGLGTYEGLHFVLWNPASKRLNRLMLSNYGEIQHSSLNPTMTGWIGTTVGPHAHLTLPRWTVWRTPDENGTATLNFYVMRDDASTLHLSEMQLRKKR